jgi:hypothetical protein
MSTNRGIETVGRAGAEYQPGVTDSYFISGDERVLGADSITVESRTIARFEVADAPTGWIMLEGRVEPGHLRIVHHDLVRVRPPDRNPVAFERYECRGRVRLPHLEVVLGHRCLPSSSRE